MSEKFDTFEEAKEHCAGLLEQWRMLTAQCSAEAVRAKEAREAVDDALSALDLDAWIPEHLLGDLGLIAAAVAGCHSKKFKCALALLSATLGILDLELGSETNPELVEALENALAEAEDAEADHEACYEPANEAFEAYVQCYQHNSPDVDLKDMQA